MANNCAFDMRITGTEDAIKELIAMLSWQGKFKERGLGRTYSFDAEELEETALPGIYTVTGYGDCAWSILTAMCAEYRKDAPSLESETERLGLVVEVFSSEPGCRFQEHYLFVKGDIKVDDCVDYEEHWVSGYTSLAAYNEEFETNFTEDMLDENGDIYIGGFGEAYANFADVTRYFVHDVINKDLAGLDICALYEHDDEICSIIKAPNAKYFNYYSMPAMIHGYGGVGPFETLEEASQMLHKHRPKAKIMPSVQEVSALDEQIKAAKSSQEAQINNYDNPVKEENSRDI